MPISSTSIKLENDTNNMLSTSVAVTPYYVTSAINEASISGTTFKGGYDASSNTFPSEEGISAGDWYEIIADGILGGQAVVIGDNIRSLVDNPSQDSNDWVIEYQRVISVFGRDGIIEAQSGDYDANQIGNCDITNDELSTLAGNTSNIADEFTSIAGLLDDIVSVLDTKQNQTLSAVELSDSIIITLDNNSNYFQYLTGTASSSNPATIILPDATTMDNGDGFWLHQSAGTAYIQIKNNSGTVLENSQWVNYCKIVLVDNSTSAGEWVIEQNQSRLWGSNRLSALLVGDGNVNNTAFGYISTLTSNAQTQLNTLASIWSTDVTDFEILPGNNYRLNLTKSNANTDNYLILGNNNPNATISTYLQVVGNTSGSGTTTSTLFEIIRATSNSANGATTFSHNGTGDFIFKANNSASLKFQTNATNRLTISDSGSTFSVPVTISSSSNQLVLGSTHTMTITSPTRTASRTFTLPDANSNSVQPSSAGSGQVATGISSSGVISFSQPTLYYNSSNTYSAGDLIVGDGTNGVLNGLYSCNTANTTGTFNISKWNLIIASRGATGASYNTYAGIECLSAITTGQFITAMGYQSLASITTNGSSVGIGFQAGQYQTGDSNVFLGAVCGQGSTGATATQITATGRRAGLSLTSSSYNCFYGHNAGSSVTSGSGYLNLFGVNSGSSITTGSNVTIIGSYSGTSTLSNSFVVSSNGASPVQIINIANTNTSPSANLVLATPNGSTGAATLRSLVYADLPTIATNTVLGNISGSATTPSSLTVSNARVANAITQYDSNANLKANGFVPSYAFRSPGASSSVILTASSAQINLLSGSNITGVYLPDATTLEAGYYYVLINQTSSSIPVYYGSGTLFQTLNAGNSITANCVGVATVAGTWAVSANSLWNLSSSVLYPNSNYNLNMVRTDTSASTLTIGNTSSSNTTNTSFNISDATYSTAVALQRTYDGYTTLLHRSTNDLIIKAQDNAKIKFVANNILALTINSANGTTDFVQNITAPMVGAGTTSPTVALHVSGGQIHKRTAVSANYTVLTTDYIVAVTSTASARTITLPSTHTAGQVYIIKDESGGANTNNITISGNGKTIDGTSTKVINTAYGVFQIYSNGTNYFTF